MNTAEICHATLNRLAKWRRFFAGWQLGTRLDTDPEAKAISNHREATMLQRVELTALTQLLIDKRVFTFDEFQVQLTLEAELLMKQYEKAYPGFKATDTGLSLTPTVACDTMRVMNFKP